MINKELLKGLNLYFPAIYKDMTNCKQCGPFALEVKTSNGAFWFYDDVQSTIRRLPQDRNSLTEEECRTEFGKRLVMMLRRKGITQEELSKRSCVSSKTLSLYITGKHTPNFYIADKIAKALECSMDHFRYY